MTLVNILCFLAYFNTGMIIYLAYKYSVLWKHYMKFAQDTNHDIDQTKTNVIRIFNILEKLKNPKKEIPIESTKEKDGK